MSPRFVSNTLLALAGGFVVVVSQAFAAGTTGWITFGIALGVLGMICLTQLDRGRGLPQRALDGIVGVLAIWTVIASVVFDGTTLTWLSFAEALGFVGLAVVGLVVHELSTERVVHSLAVEDGRRTAPEYSAS